MNKGDQERNLMNLTDSRISLNTEQRFCFSPSPLLAYFQKTAFSSHAFVSSDNI